MEKITDLDESMLLGYFETVRSVFLTKLLFQFTMLNEKDGRKFFDSSRLSDHAIAAVSAQFDDPIFFKALKKGNEELYLNYKDDTLTALLSSSWNIFEQVTKDLVKPNYSTELDELSVCYQNGRFRFDKREKKDIELFYYIRNAIHHHNGAYYATKDIDHRYAGVDFVSKNHHGEKIDTDLKTVWQMAKDLEKYTMKAWSNCKAAPLSHGQGQ